VEHVAQRVDPPVPPFPELICGSKRPANVPWNVLALALALGVALKLFGPEWLSILFQSAGGGTLEGLGALLLATAASVLLHEAGHLIAALLFDFEVLGGSLGPIRAVRLHGRWSVHPSGRLFTGSVIAIPRRNSGTWRTRMLCVVAGGPAVTFLTMLVAAGFLVGCADPAAWNARFLSALVELNLFLFVLGLFPNASGARSQNDARLFYSLLQNTPEAEEILVYHLLTQLQIAGVRPREYQEAIMRRLATARGKPEMCAAYAAAIACWALDRGDLETADAWDKRAVDLSDFCDLKLQNGTLAASACWDVVVRDDLRGARAKFTDVELEMLAPKWFQHRAKAASALVSGQIVHALAEIARARYSFPNRLPYFEFESMLLGRLHARAIATQPRELISGRTSRAV
jgi:hypothetical protein